MKKDYQFKHGNNTPILKRNKRKPKPAPPINSRRNPSVLNSEPDYEEVYSKKIEDRLFELDCIDLNAEVQKQKTSEPIKTEPDIIPEQDDVKIYQPRRKNTPKQPDKEIYEPKKTRRMIILAIVLGLLGVGFLTLGVCIGLSYIL